MNDSLGIPVQNQPQHLDIEKEIQKKYSGLFNVVIRVNGRQIVDLVFMENKIYGPQSKTTPTH